MGETISLDDYTTLPGKSGATHSISLCIALGITSTEEEMHKDMLRRQIIADTKSQAMAAARD